jgi:hypothetical protein
VYKVTPMMMAISINVKPKLPRPAGIPVTWSPTNTYHVQ